MLCLNYTDGKYLTIRPWTEECVSLNFSKTNGYPEIVASIYTQNVHLYGGPIMRKSWNQMNWPWEKNSFYEAQYMKIRSTYENSDSHYYAVLEPYWLLSNGHYIYVDNNVPLFISLISENTFELIAQDKTYQSRELALNFILCKLDDAREAHEHAIKHFLGKPSTLPDIRGVKQPIWTTCDVSEFTVDLDQTAIVNFTKEIIENGYGGRIVIRHNWENDLGSLEPDSHQFWDFKGLINELKNLNFTLALRVHPFVSRRAYHELPEKERDYLISDGAFFHHKFGDYINSTDPDALNWFRERLAHLRKTYGIDSFEFDNGDYADAILNMRGPNVVETIIKENTRMLANLSSNIVSYVARGTQMYGILLQMPLESHTANDYWLKDIISNLLQMNILGYSFILPGIVEKDKWDDGEMFLRWVQLCVFMPFMQFSMSKSPWSYDEEVPMYCIIMLSAFKKYK